MPPTSRYFPGDEELGKKDDDHRPGSKRPLDMAWQHRRLPSGLHRRSIRRLGLGILVLVALYLFFKNMPTDLTNPRSRPNYDYSSSQGSLVSGPIAHQPPFGSRSSTAASYPEASNVPVQHDFNGPIRFYDLAVTLHQVPQVRSDIQNTNVVFAAASLKSAAFLLPIACEMAAKKRNSVHFALMGRDDISMDILKAVNGISKECDVLFHDARPDFSSQSSDNRMVVSCSAGFGHLNTFIHPKATIVDGSTQEEQYFINGLRGRAAYLHSTLIELPPNTEDNLMWITKLDSSSLSYWNEVTIDILVHAPTAASGSLIRLLESLSRADYFSSSPPRLTIELPHQIDIDTKRYLERFVWPPNRGQHEGNLLILHHRIPQSALTPEGNAVRFLEAFWPSKESTSHMFMLSPQAELSPLFFHYLKYHLLEYKYSKTASVFRANLLGISLESPTLNLDDSTPFVPPLMENPSEEENAPEVLAPFLWQAPNSHAVLYFGDKWMELHDFVARLLSRDPQVKSTFNKHRTINKTYPSWLEYLYVLARARSYFLLYPSFEGPETIVTLHTELYQPPEEHLDDINKSEGQLGEHGELTADSLKHISNKHAESLLASKSILTILPMEGLLPSMWNMPLLAWDGVRSTLNEIQEGSLDYRHKFRQEIGGCEANEEDTPTVNLQAGDLFCSREEEQEEKHEVETPNADLKANTIAVSVKEDDLKPVADEEVSPKWDETVESEISIDTLQT